METTKERTYSKDVDLHNIKRISWSAIFAGTLIMLVVLMILSLLGLGIGLGTINPADEANPLQGIGTGAIIWWIISNLIAVFVGAFVAANLTNLPFKYSGILHGIVSWSLYTLISFWLMTSAIGGIVGGVGSMVSKTVSGLGQNISKVVSMDGQQGQKNGEQMFDTDRLNQMIQQVLVQEQGQDTAKKFDINVLAIIQEVFIENGQIKTDVQRQEIVDAVAENSTLSEQDAERAADVIMQQYQEVEQEWQQFKQQAEQTAQKAASAASSAAIWSFIALLFGAIVAAIGGWIGESKSTGTRNTRSI